MKRFDSYEKYCLIVEPYCRSSVYSNVFFMKEQLIRMIEQGVLYYKEADGNLLLFETADGFYRFYYYLTRDHLTLEPAHKWPAVVEFVYNGEMSEKQKKETELLTNSGFRLVRKSRRMKIDDLDRYRLDNESRQDVFKVRPAGCGDADRVRQILKDSFNPLVARIPSSEEMPGLIRQNRIFVAVRGDDILGVTHFELKRKTAIVWQFAVDEAERGKGIGSALYKETLRHLGTQVETVFTWVGVENVGAIRLYQRLGYQFDLKHSDEYVYPVSAGE